MQQDLRHTLQILPPSLDANKFSERTCLKILEAGGRTLEALIEKIHPATFTSTQWNSLYKKAVEHNPLTIEFVPPNSRDDDMYK